MSSFYESLRSNYYQLLQDLEADPGAALDNSRRWAEAVRRGAIFFYDKQEVVIGRRGIDWTGRHVKHQEWPAQLNRFFSLRHLLTVYQAGEGDDLPALAREMIDDWIEQHDYSAAAPPTAGDNTLNISIRLGQSSGRGWWPIIAEFNRPDVFDDVFMSRACKSTAGQLDCLRAHLAPKGNWRISHLDTLLFCGLVVPGLDAHLTFAVEMLNECFHRQVHADGAHEEHCPSYHSWMCQVATAYWRLSRERPELGLHLETERVARMCDYLVCSMAPDSGSLALNDSSAWRPLGRDLDGPRRRRQAFLDAAGLTGPDWDLDATPSRYFPDAGQLYLRTGWGPDHGCTVFDLSRWHGWHSHLGRNSVNLFCGGHYLLPDPGIFSYEGSDPFAAYGRSTPAHNTVNFALMNQSEANPDVHAIHVFADLAVAASDYQGGYFGGDFHGGWYSGHRPGVFGTHERILLWLGDLGCLVWDFCNVDLPGQAVSAHWNLGRPETAADECRAWTCGEGTQVLVQLVDSDMTITTRVIKGQIPPALGWRPLDASGGREPAPLLSFAGQARSRSARICTLLHPFAGDPPKVAVETFSCTYGRAVGCRLRWPDGAELTAAATPRLANQVGQAGPLDSDGALAAVLCQQGRIRRALTIAGTYLRLDDLELLRESRAGAHYCQL